DGTREPQRDRGREEQRSIAAHGRPGAGQCEPEAAQVERRRYGTSRRPVGWNSSNRAMRRTLRVPGQAVARPMAEPGHEAASLGSLLVTTAGCGCSLLQLSTRITAIRSMGPTIWKGRTCLPKPMGGGMK